MTALKNKIDFALIFTVHNANPNGDPLDGNRPRTTYEGLGEVSDVCLKRKIRNRWIDEGYSVFVQSDARRAPGEIIIAPCANVRRAAQALKRCQADSTPREKGRARGRHARRLRAHRVRNLAGRPRALDRCSRLRAARATRASTVCRWRIRGPVSIHPAFSTETVNVVSTQITKSVNLETGANPDMKAPDTMGMKHRVDRGVYVTYGSINVQPAEKTGFSEEDAQALKEALRTIFRNDATAARPDGSMEVVKLIWWEHNCPNGQYSAAKVHRSVQIEAGKDGMPRVSVDETAIPGLKYTLIDGE